MAGKGKAPAVKVEDDDDLDDLDDVLEQFNKPAPAPIKPPASKPKLGPEPPPNTAVEGEDAEMEAAFAAELAAGMESLMKELAGGIPTGEGGEGLNEEEARKAFEKMLIQDLESGGAGMFGEEFKEFKGAGGSVPKAPTASGAGASSSTKPPDDFQKSIKEAVDRLKNSDDTLKADAANSSDPLAQLLSGLGDLGDLGDGDGQDMQKLLESMMSQLMSKELLYEPLKELDEKYPEYFKEHSSKLSASDLEKYQKQHTLVTQTVKIFELPNYSDDNPEQSAQILKLMNEMQALGSPPQEIMGELPPGFSLGADGLPNMEGAEGCIIS